MLNLCLLYTDSFWMRDRSTDRERGQLTELTTWVVFNSSQVKTTRVQSLDERADWNVTKVSLLLG